MFLFHVDNKVFSRITEKNNRQITDHRELGFTDHRKNKSKITDHSKNNSERMRVRVYISSNWPFSVNLDH